MKKEMEKEMEMEKETETENIPKEKEIENHIRYIHSLDLLPEDHVEYLVHLKNNGFEPKVIYDIGSCVGHWTREAEKIWPNAKIILFDALELLEFLYQEKFNNYDYHLGVLSSEDDKTVKFYQDPFNLGGNSYYKEIGSHYFNTPEHLFVYKKTKKLDTIVKEKSFPLPDLIKMDVQGAEKDIIKGALETIKNCKHLIVEMQIVDFNQGAPKAEETGPYIESLGYKCIGYRFSDNGPDADYGFMRI
jgi:FkbM family methyltransferase